jgi:hypothetical protein
MVINLGVRGSFNRFASQSESAKFSSVFGVQGEVIDPFVEVCAGSELHFSGYPVRKSVMLKEREDEFSQRSLGLYASSQLNLSSSIREMRIAELGKGGIGEMRIADCGLRNFWEGN